MGIIVFLDIMTFMVSIASTIVLIWGWKKYGELNSKIVLLILLCFTIFYYSCLVMKWGGYINLNPYEDIIAAILPMIWAFLFYSLIMDRKNKDLYRSKANLKRTLNSIDDGVITTDIKGVIKIINPVAQKLTGWHYTEATGMNLEEVFHLVNNKTEEKLDNPVKNILQNNQKDEFTNPNTLVSKSGTKYYIASSAAPIEDIQGNILGTVIVFRDITKKYEMEQKIIDKTESLQNYKNRLETIMRIGGVTWWEYNFKDRSFIFAPQWARMLGYSPGRFNKYEDFAELIHKEDRERVRKIRIEKLKQTEEIYRLDYRMKTRDKEYKWVHDIGGITERDEEGKPQKAHGALVDITKNKQVEEEIRKQLQEKQTLLKELSHRTKNNMQQISSMLSLKASRSNNKKVREALKDIKQKIYSLSLIHKMLHESENLSKLNLGQYIQRLTSYLRMAYNNSEKEIDFQVNIGINKVAILIDVAIPLGLAINELVTNSIQHGFRNKREGRIEIEVKKVSDKVSIIIADNGSGLPEEKNIESVPGMGINIVKGLIEGQLGGEIYFEEKKQGMRCKIIFDPNQYKERI